MSTETIQFVGLDLSQFKNDLLEETKSIILDLVKNNQPANQEIYLTRKQVADLVGGISIGTVKNWSKKGILNEYGIGRLVRYKKSEVEKAIVKLNQ